MSVDENQLTTTYSVYSSQGDTQVKKISIPTRQHSAEDKDYYYFLLVAKESMRYWYAQYAIELAYLCRMRMCEVLELTDANELPNGLIVHRRKRQQN